MLDVYMDFAEREAALAPVPGRKSESERFPGADVSYSLEAMMGDGRALQAATAHNLGQNFARVFDIRYLDRRNEQQYCWTTSWGFSTRVIGAIIMTHGDDRGLILPPRLAPYQAVIVPIYRNDTERGPVLEAVAQAQARLLAQDVRVQVDNRDDLTPGFKFNDWELRGVPLRVEIGPRDVARGTATLVRRDRLGQAGKTAVPVDGLSAAVAETLRDLQAALYERALAFRQSHTYNPSSYQAFKQAMEQGWALAWWCGQSECEAAIKADTRATTRCLPLDQPGGTGRCVRCGLEAREKAIFGRSY
jgi:prolyl-tRNA synthetase